MNIGIRLHDTAGTTLAEQLAAAKSQDFTCVHIALDRVTPGISMDNAPELLTDALVGEKAVIADGIVRLDRSMSLHMKAFIPYAPLLALAKANYIPMTLENTHPGNAVAAREHLEKVGAAL